MLQRGTYGVEWSNRPRDEGPSPLGLIVFAVLLVALVSFGCTLFARFRANRARAVEDGELAVVMRTAESPVPEVREAPAPQPVDVAQEEPPPPPPPTVSRPEKRPPKVRNLLMRLEEAEKARDVEMAISTIETLRAIPGSPAADLDNALARRLGVLNTKRLFELKSALWIDTITVKSGDSASRIASEHGATLSSVVKLNGPIDKLKIGQKLYVLNHPRFNLVVHRLARIADLQLNGKFFKRYDLTDVSTLKDGAFEWREVSLKMKPADKAELDLLLPKATSVLISEM